MANMQTRRKMKRLRNRNKKSSKKGGFLQYFMPNRCAACAVNPQQFGCSLCSRSSNVVQYQPQYGVPQNRSIFGSLFGSNNANPVVPANMNVPSNLTTNPQGIGALSSFYSGLGTDALSSQPLTNNSLTGSSFQFPQQQGMQPSFTQKYPSSFQQQSQYGNQPAMVDNSNAFRNIDLNKYNLLGGKHKTQRGGYTAYNNTENVATYASPFKGGITAQPQVWVGGKTKKRRYNRKQRK